MILAGHLVECRWVVVELFLIYEERGGIRGEGSQELTLWAILFCGLTERTSLPHHTGSPKWARLENEDSGEPHIEITGRGECGALYFVS